MSKIKNVCQIVRINKDIINSIHWYEKNNNVLVEDSSFFYPVYENVKGNRLCINQFYAIIMKRWLCTRRNWRALFSQIILPAIFVIVAMSVALTVALLEELPPMELSPAQYYNYTQPHGNVIVFSNNESPGRIPPNLTGFNSVIKIKYTLFVFVCSSIMYITCITFVIQYPYIKYPYIIYNTDINNIYI